MHIPSQMLEGAICPITTGIAIAGVGTATYFAYKSKNKPSILRFSALTSFVFAAQMINFPVQGGTSGHLIGAVLLAALMGVPFGILAMSIVISVQAIFFADGGIAIMGANIINMAIIASLGGLLIKKKLPGIALAAFISVPLAATACSIELWLAGSIPLTKVLPAMLGIHLLIGLGEAAITAGAYKLFTAAGSRRTIQKQYSVPLISAIVLAALFSPFASGFPDGLEWVAGNLNILKESAAAGLAPMPDYLFPFISNSFIATSLAALAGTTIIFVFAFGLGKTLITGRAAK